MPAIVRGGGGGKNTKDATAVPGDVKKGKLFYGRNGREVGVKDFSKFIEEKSIVIPKQEDWNEVKRGYCVAVHEYSGHYLSTTEMELLHWTDAEKDTDLNGTVISLGLKKVMGLTFNNKRREIMWNPNMEWENYGYNSRGLKIRIKGDNGDMLAYFVIYNGNLYLEINKYQGQLILHYI